MPTKRLGSLALPATEIDTVSAAHPVREKDFINVIGGDNITLGDQGTSDGFVTNSEVVYQDGSSSKDRQNVQAEICSSKNKKRKRGGKIIP